MSVSLDPKMADDQAMRLSHAEISALTQRGVWSRLGFSVFVGLIASTIVPWTAIAAWLSIVFVWDLVGRPALERWAGARSHAASSEASVRGFALTYALGAAIYSGLAVLCYLSQTALGAQIAMGWIAGAAIHAFVYFSHRRLLLAANLWAPVCVALFMPAIAAGSISVETALVTLATFTLLASAAIFATDRNALLVHLGRQIHARRVAEDANEAKTQFLRVISHELRTPLNAVIGYSELLEEDLAAMGAETQRRDAETIRTAGKHLLGLINDILRLSQREAHAALLDDVETDLDHLLAELEEEVQPLAVARGNQLVLDVKPLPPAMLDRAKLRDCLSKLLSNAAKFTENGRIDVRAWAAPERLVFEIADSGIGMSPAQVATVFEAFAQADSSLTRSAGGAGLGLAVARKNARLMGGDISVESALGAGTVFTLWLPINAGSNEPPAEARSLQHEAAPRLAQSEAAAAACAERCAAS
ncbi:sensor histidine kinase [Terricaulis sp.]|uniref:sensor histidine kinase n=1 Tax=Terricaulis sp. TaxID=2768686 RepID=UPI00378430A4